MGIVTDGAPSLIGSKTVWSFFCASSDSRKN